MTSAVALNQNSTASGGEGALWTSCCISFASSECFLGSNEGVEAFGYATKGEVGEDTELSACPSRLTSV